MTEGTHIRFDYISATPSGKTHRWSVVEKESNLSLGDIRWYGPWRRYCFWPARGLETIFEQVCLREIADFIEMHTNAHRKASAA